MQVRQASIYVLATLVALFTTVTTATPTLNVTPGTIARDAVGDVQIDVGSVAGSSVILELYVDADGDGVIDAEDYPIWTDTIEDNFAEWSPEMASDDDGATGAITVDVRMFGPLGFPYTSGDFIWRAEDSFDATSTTQPFIVTQPIESQSVSGTVTDSGTAAPIPGALVFLEPFCDIQEGVGIYSTIADETGAFDIQVSADLDCDHHLLIAARPGYVSGFLDLPHLQFAGTSTFSGQALELTPGDWPVDGSVVYETGPRIAQGVPGVAVFAELAGAPGGFAVAFSDRNGDYLFMLPDGPWEMEYPENVMSRGAVMSEEDIEFDVDGAPLTLPDIGLTAANAFFQGTLYDDVGSAHGGVWVEARESWPCDPCFFDEALTRADGSYTVGAVAPDGPAFEDYSLGVPDPLPGLIAEQSGCETISANQTLTGKDLDHLAPTGFITGVMVDRDNETLESMCIEAWSNDACTSYHAQVMTECDGTYSLPIIDGQWDMQVDVDDLASIFRELDETVVRRQVTVDGSEDEVDFVIGRSRFLPTIVFLEPSSATVGSHVLIEGYGFSLGTAPEVYFGVTAATVVAFRPDLGEIVAEVPGSLGAGNHLVTVYNPDLDLFSDPACFEVEAGAFQSTCTISGHVTDPVAGDVEGATIAVWDIDDDILLRADVTDASGLYSVDFEFSGPFYVGFLPPQGQPWTWGFYEISCGVQDHAFVTGVELSGHVRSDSFDDIANAAIEITDIVTEYEASTMTDEDGNFVLYVPPGTFDLYIDAPAGGRFIAPPQPQVVVSGNTVVPEIVMSQGSLFSGAIVDVHGLPLQAEIEAFDKNTEQWSGFADTDSCSGRFVIPLPPGEFRLELWPLAFDAPNPTEVKFIEMDGDQVAGFDFPVLPPQGLQLTGPEPRIMFVEPFPAGQVGQPMQLFAENIDGTAVDVLFSNGAGGFVPGTQTLWDPDRGLVLTRIPAGASSGEMKLQVDLLDSPPMPFDLLPGPFPPGAFTVDGDLTDQGAPVDGGLALLFWRGPPGAGCDDDDDGVLYDYGLSDVTGAYGPLDHPGGDFELALLPPGASTLAPFATEQLGVQTNTIFDHAFLTGVQLQVWAVDDQLAPIPNAVFEAEGDTSFDTRLTDNTGYATLYVSPGDLEFFLLPPMHSRFIEDEWAQTIAGPVNFGNRTMTTGVMISSAVFADATGLPVQGALVESQLDGDPWTFFFETQTRLGGLFLGPVLPGSTIQLRVEPINDDLADLFASGLAIGPNDRIAYPPIELEPAGFLSGFVRDAGSSPLQQIPVTSFADDAGSPGPWTGYAETCPDGSYLMKLPVGDHFIEANAFVQNGFVHEWYQDAYCSEDAGTVTITAGNTSTADFDLETAGSVSGTVTLNGLPLEGVHMCLSSDATGTCQFCGVETDAAGNYSLFGPPATDHKVEAFSPGVGLMCWDDFPGCSDFDPVTTVGGSDTSGIDFELGCDAGTEEFVDDLELGAAGWTAGGLWQLITDPTCSPSAHSGNSSFHYGQLSCDYDTGSANAGTLTSPVIGNVPAGATLTYWQRRQTDGNCFATDRSRVLLWVNGSGPTEIWEECDNSNEWQPKLLDLAPYYAPGDSLQIGFDFDSTDEFNNQFLGWMIDDVRVYACGIDCPLDPNNDEDADGVCGDVDNCPTIPNNGQADSDFDGIGDACDFCPDDPGNDPDQDGVCTLFDNCPGTPNPGQENIDGDADGDACDFCPNDPLNDSDFDGVCGDVDNCPNTPNPGQADADGDGQGDVCDPCANDPENDVDTDGVCGDVDNCPNTPNPGQADADGDGQGDVCDPCANDPENDVDTDGVCGDVDNCPNTPNPDQVDADGDGEGDVCDACANDPENDVDTDGVCGDVDNCPNTPNPGQADADGDGQGDVCDPCANDPENDVDTDGVCGDVDNCPNTSNVSQTDGDGDGQGDACDPCANDPENDADTDGVCGDVDNCPQNANAGQQNADGDAFGDACDICPDDPNNDVDSDLVCGDVDNCENVPNPGQENADGDVNGDACDECPNDSADDADSDGVCGDVDNCPIDPNSGQENADADANGDACDVCPNDPGDDADADGLCADVDNCPALPNAGQQDNDNDGAGDVCDADDDNDEVEDEFDNCLTIPNPAQADRDLDGTGNVCDPWLFDFAPTGSTVPEGYVHVDGALFSAAFGFGWSEGVLLRERATPVQPPLATFAYTQTVKRWRVEMPNGEYAVKVIVGDPSFPHGTQRVVANGVTILDGVTTAAGQFTEATEVVEIRNGLLELEIGGGTGNTALNVVEVVETDKPAASISINFQKSSSDTPDGYQADTGSPFDSEVGYGWDASRPSRERNKDVPQTQDTFVFSSSVAEWELNLPQGAYQVLVSAGDAEWAQGPQRVIVEGTTVINDQPTAAGEFAESTTLIGTVDGRLTVRIGGGGGLTTINQLVVTPAAPDIDEDQVPNASDNCPIVSNPVQQDSDSDLLGDACDACPDDPANDADADGVCGDVDNCPATANPDQNDNDTDGSGDACDTDDDNDGVDDGVDNCPLAANPAQVDRDEDGDGNSCDPWLIDFAPTSATVPQGYLHADTSLFSGATGSGWSGNVIARERATAVTAPLSTFVSTQAVRFWRIEMPNGDYSVTAIVGDASYAQGTQRVLANDVTVLDGVSTATGEFFDASAVVQVRNGVLELEVGGGSGNTALNVVELRETDAVATETSINFQPANSDTPEGYLADSGLVYDVGRGYGWDAQRPARDRGKNVPQALDTFVYSSDTAVWEMDLTPGAYEVLVSVGDAQFAGGPHRVIVEGATVVGDESTGAGQFVEQSAVVGVTDGKLTVRIGGGGGLTTIDQLIVSPATADVDEDGVPNVSDNCPVLSNPGQADTDSDGQGDLCDVCPSDATNDADADGVCGGSDNCPAVANAGQENADADSNGDACDVCPNDPADDADADGVCGDVDNCPAVVNAGQENADADGQGDACDVCPSDPLNDVDSDGVCGSSDNCPEEANPDQTNSDADGDGDACDADDDNDGVADGSDNCPLAPNANQADRDTDSVGNVCDPLLIDFAPTASTVPQGYLHADTSLFSVGQGFGWSGNVIARERATAVTAPLSTFVSTSAVRLWRMEMANGDYLMEVTVGDPSYPQGTQRVLANGVMLTNEVTTGAGQFDTAQAIVSVRNGILELEVGGGTGNTALNVVEITETDASIPPVSVNFQRTSSTLPDGYVADTGLVYDVGRGYGWDVPLPSRERNQNIPQVQDTFVYSSSFATWELDVANGVYEVLVTVGDAAYAHGPMRVTLEQVVVFGDQALAAGEVIELVNVTAVNDGKLSVRIGGGGGNTMIQQVVVTQISTGDASAGNANGGALHDNWGHTWDGVQRTSDTWATANSTCTGLGGRLPSVTELWRNNATTGSGNLSDVTATGSLWTLIHSGAGSTNRVGVQLGDGTVVQHDESQTLPYRCVWPGAPTDGFSGRACNGPAGSGCWESGQLWNVDVEDRPALQHAAAVSECNFHGGSLWTLRDMEEAVHDGLPNGSNEWLWTSNVKYWYNGGYGATLVRWSGLSAGDWVYKSTNGALSGANSPRRFRCVGPRSGSVGVSPPAPACEGGCFSAGSGRSGLAADSLDRSAQTQAAAADACRQLGGSLPNADEFAELVHAGWTNGSNNWIWTAQPVYWYSGSYGVVSMRFNGTGAADWQPSSSTFGLHLATSSIPFRCVWHETAELNPVTCAATENRSWDGAQFTCEAPIDGDSAGAANTGQFLDAWGNAWDSTERSADNYPNADAQCASQGGRLPTPTELYRIRAGNALVSAIDNPTTSWLWTLAPLDNPGERTTVRVNDGLMSASPEGLLVAYRCIWPTTRGDVFSGRSCHGEPADPCYESGGLTVDRYDRAALREASASFECSYLGGRLPEYRELQELIHSGLPNGTNNWLWLAEPLYWYNGNYGYALARWSGTGTSSWAYTSTTTGSLAGPNSVYRFRCIFNEELD